MCYKIYEKITRAQVLREVLLSVHRAETSINRNDVKNTNLPGQEMFKVSI